MIRLADVSKSYGSVRALGPVDLDIPRGGITALVGPNGAGKSTMLTVVGRLLDPDTGQVHVGGLDVVTARSKDLAKVLAVLRQENHFVTRLTVRQLVSFGRFPHSGGRLTAEDHAKVDDALEFLDLAPLAARFLDELSGGQRQRAYVAMVLAQDTDYLLLDEPLNNLDVRHAVSMMKQLRRAADELGRTVVIVIHDVNFAAAYADHVVMMVDGGVHLAGPPSEVITSEVLTEVFRTPVDVLEHHGRPLAVYYR
ncbi:iron ABC transporter ATP-binding protein [Sanguibacter suaedae]|uniref:ATP-binding cassette domain-containing protein n=1 Tax=Sanguibacter suaedae TaxID=2795737 RepID=A0A934I4Z5_9MICO|nr:ATP-binding cassette domain-containing protein [Sanguibacter suaedae]MBI9115684.1 ATP-binding cassette domain-containing protein [Sanguibacter suaedae]